MAELSRNDSEHIFDFLITNRDFREWVLNPASARKHFWENWVEQNQHHSETIQEVRNILLSMRFEEHSLPQTQLDQILTEVIKSDTQEETKSVRKWLWIAAILLVLTSTTIIFLKFSASPGDSIAIKTVSNPKGQKSKLTLSDGTLVYLNGGSTLEIPSQFNKDLRQVNLDGEAYFEVNEDGSRPFEVNSNGITTRVLGTKFNIDSRYAEVGVSLLEGSLIVSGKGISKTEGRLLPGERLSYDIYGESYYKDVFDPEVVTSWKEGVLTFKNDSFASFVSRMENWYGIEFKIERSPASDWSITQRFAEKSLEEVLASVQQSSSLKFRIQGNSVSIY